MFARDLEAAGRAHATIARRLSTIAGLYREAVEEELLDHSSAVHVRRPRIDCESHATGLDRNEVGGAARRRRARHRGRAFADLPARAERLRVSEATGVDIEALGNERGRRTLADHS
jgi:integrase/recombinase XerD